MVINPFNDSSEKWIAKTNQSSLDDDIIVKLFICSDYIKGPDANIDENDPEKGLMGHSQMRSPQARSLG